MYLINKLSQGIDFGIRFTLEVFGASGAIWGASEVMHLRNEENKEYWRVAAIGIGVLALARFVCQNLNLQNRVTKKENKELSALPS